jgi:hypothetical protein
MTLVSAEETAARRQSWREDVQWNIARCDEAFRIANSIVGEDLTNEEGRYGEDWRDHPFTLGAARGRSGPKFGNHTMTSSIAITPL